MKIAFFCGHPFGLRGTPGTYMFIKKISQYADVLIFSSCKTDDCVVTTNGLPIIFLTYSTQKNIENILPALCTFDPDIVYIFNFPRWPELLDILKNTHKTKYVLDIKTPLFAEEQSRKIIQSKCNKIYHQLDKILTLSKQSVKTWIPDCSTDPVEYPLGIDIESFGRHHSSSHSNPPYEKFIYIGSIHKKRKLDKLIEGFERFHERSKNNNVLDIYGSGPESEIKKLNEYIAAHGLFNNIKLKGLLPQKKLFHILPSYDAGIAWVPKEIYNDSPSLKILEYMAGNLPVLSTNTNAHKSLVSKNFVIKLCDDNPDSLTESLLVFADKGIHQTYISKNFKLVIQFDYTSIVKNYIFPELESLVNQPRATTKQFNCLTKYKNKFSSIVKKNNQSTRKNCSKCKKHKKLTLSLVIPSLSAGKGGAERVAMETADMMVSRGHLVYIIYKNNGPAAYSSTTDKIVHIPYNELSSISYQLKNINPDVFFCFYVDRNLLNFYKLVYKTNIPFGIQECTNPQRLCENNWWRKNKFDKVTASWEREVIASAAARIRLTMPGYVNSFPGYIQPQTRAFPNPCFSQSELKNPVSDTNDRKIILNINGFKANKNLITLIQAFARVAPVFPDWDIKVIGKPASGDEPHKQKIRQFISENNLQDRIIIHGPVDDVYEHFRTSSIHVIASLSEGCPTVVLEAMSVGLPSIGFADCCGTNELIKHNQNGLLASSEDRVSSLEFELRKLMSSPELRARLGSQALEDSKHFDPRNIYDQWEQLFYEAAEYKNDPERLFREQMAINPEKAMHARRMREKLMQQIKVT